MVRDLVRLLPRLTLACPLCAVPEGTQMAVGVRAGALVLIAATATVLAAMAVYAVRLWRSERDAR
jgi:hypothetical protein